jgi:hypothetical protein
MKRLTAIILVLSLFLLLPACAAANPAGIDVDALEQQVAADFAKHGKDDARFFDFYYLGTDNGYHIVWFSLIGYALCDAPHKIDIEGYEIEVGGGCYLIAYKKGEFVNLESAYGDGLISKEAITKAAEHYAEQKNSTE